MLKDYEKQNFFLLPLPRLQKFPPPTKWNKSTSKYEIRNGGNVGIACGEMSGIFVLDIDVKKEKESDKKFVCGLTVWKQLCEKFGEPNTGIVSTPSGGLHYYFKLDEKCKKFKMTSKAAKMGDRKITIDIRSDNSYCVAPPSILSHGSYQWLKSFENISPIPMWVCQLLSQDYMLTDDLEFYEDIQVPKLHHTKKRKLENLSPTKKEPTAIKKYSLDEVAILLDLVDDEHFVDYRDWVKVGCLLKREFGEDAFELFKEHSMRSDFHDDCDHRKFWDSFKVNNEREATLGTLVMWAKKDSPEDYEEIFGKKIKYFNLEDFEGLGQAEPIEISLDYLIENFSRYDEGMSDIYVKVEKDVKVIQKSGLCYFWNKKTLLWEERDTEFLLNRVTEKLEPLYRQTREHVFKNLPSNDKYEKLKAEHEKDQEAQYILSRKAEAERKDLIARARADKDLTKAQLDKIIDENPKIYVHKKVPFRKATKEEKTDFEKIAMTKWDKIERNILTTRGSSDIAKKAITKLREPDFINNFNKCQDTLPLRDGQVINLKTGEIRKRNRKDYFCFECPASITEDQSKVDFVESKIKEICNGDEQLMYYLQILLGYCLTGHINERIFLIWWGIGSNGKSILTGMMRNILGDFYGTIDKKAILQSTNFSSGAATPELFSLIGKRLVILSETAEDDKIDETIVKAMTGDNNISCRKLYGDMVSFKPICKILMETNNRPNIDASDQATLDRLRLFPFTARFVKNPIKGQYLQDIHLAEKLKTEYLDSFMTWCVRGAKLWYENNLPKVPKAMETVTAEYVSEQDTIQNFLQSNFTICKSECDHFIYLKDIVSKFSRWAKTNNEKELSSRLLSSKLVKKGFIKKRKKQGVCFMGLQMPYTTNENLEEVSTTACT